MFECELVIVVGLCNLLNLVWLVEVVLGVGVWVVYLVDWVDDIDLVWLDGVIMVGVMLGVLVFEVLVCGVLEWLVECGYDIV